MTTSHSTQEPPQHLQALARGNALRIQRALLKRRVAAGEVDVAELIRKAPKILRPAKRESHPITVYEILTWRRGWGKTRASKFLIGQGISKTATPFTLSGSRRLALALALKDAAR